MSSGCQDGQNLWPSGTRGMETTCCRFAAGKPAVSCAAPAPVVEYIAPALAMSFIAPAPVVENIAPAPGSVRSTSTRLWKFSCGKTCALSPVSDAELGKVPYRVPLSRHMGCCWRAQILLHSLRNACPLCGASNLGDSFWFLVLHKNVPFLHSLDIIAKRKASREASCGFRNVKTTLRASLAQHAVPVLSAVSFLLACSELPCTPVPAAFRSVLAPCGMTRVMVQSYQWRGSGGCRVHSALSRSLDGRISRLSFTQCW